MATASEDRTIKLWKTSSLMSQDPSSTLGSSIEPYPDIQPFQTLRGHSDRIFTMTGSQDLTDAAFQNFIYTAGESGDI